jgi:hypothetical protein
MGAVLGHGFHPLKARQPRSIPNLQSVHRQGRTPVPDSLAQSVIKDGPWTLHESAGDHDRNRERHRGDERDDDDEARESFAHDASGIVPTSPGPPYAGSGTPYAGYCDAAGKPTVNHGYSLMQPYYFPFVRRHDDILEGFFDYRPRNQQEATVAAISTDWGVSWTFKSKVLALNPYCPWDPTDPDNLNLSVNGLKTAYGSSSANAADNGSSPHRQPSWLSRWPPRP